MNHYWKRKWLRVVGKVNWETFSAPKKDSTHGSIRIKLLGKITFCSILRSTANMRCECDREWNPLFSQSVSSNKIELRMAQWSETFFIISSLHMYVYNMVQHQKKWFNIERYNWYKCFYVANVSSDFFRFSLIRVFFSSCCKSQQYERAFRILFFLKSPERKTN